MSIDRRLLVILGRRLPAIYDIIPRGPLSRFSEVALNPQPLSPHELGAAIAADFVHTAWLADRFGLDLELAFNNLDDWCPTVPKKLKLPPWWPPIPEPDPHPEWFIKSAQISLQLGIMQCLRLTVARSTHLADRDVLLSADAP